MQRIHILAGPTASGKSARALEIAQKQGGVIINADAMQVYRELPILTAQPSAAERERVPHRLYGVLSATEACSAGIWARMAEREIRKCWEAGSLPIVTGGTGLYLKALIEGFSPMPGIEKGIRDWASGVWEKLGPEAFHSLLMEKDPPTAKRLKVNDKQRRIRALEVLEATGKPLSEWQALPRERFFAPECFTIEIISLPRAELYARCDARFMQMLEAGALEEVRQFKSSLREGGGVREQASPPVTRALGFTELSNCLDGRYSLEEAIPKARQVTRHYAKRQATWFRHQLRKP